MNESRQKSAGSNQIPSQSPELTRLLLSAVNDYAIFMLDTKGHIVTWNAGAKLIKGYESDEALNKHFSIFYPEEDVKEGKPNQHLKEALENGRSEDTGWRVRKDGTKFWANVIITPIVDHAGTHQGFAKVSRDLTKQLLAEQRLKEFYVILAHELRTPLFSLRGSLDLVGGNTIKPEQKTELIEIAQIEAQRMLRLIDDLLDLKKIEVGELNLRLSVVAPEQILRKAVNALSGMAIESEVKIVVHGHCKKPLPCDQDRIIQVFTNLVANAIKYSPPQSTIDIFMEETPLGVQFQIMDRGPGISPAELAILFEKFHQGQSASGRYTSSGLGLAISKSIIERHGGKIGVDSKIGVGTTVWFELPTV
jgi:PAS domain S-box-containing protein